MKKGLGRGLSSLLNIYEDDEQPNKKQVNSTIEDDSMQSTDDVLQNAKNLLDSINKKERSFDIIDTDETVENNNYISSRNSVQEKLNKANSQGYLSSESGVKTLPLSVIEPNPNQPRKTFDPESLKELAQSIQIHGVIQPIVVCPKGDGTYIIIAGERRYKASKLAKMESIPVIIKRYTEQEMKEIALIENLQRDDLNPIETAYAMKQLVDEFGFTQDAIAKRLGISRPNVTNTIRLLSLTPEVMALVEQGKLAPNSARALVIIQDKDLQIELAKKAISQQMTTRQIEKLVKETLNPELKKKKPGMQSIPELFALKELMQHSFGTKINIIGNDKRGRIYIDYYGRDDLDRISEVLNKLDRNF